MAVYTDYVSYVIGPLRGIYGDFGNVLRILAENAAVLLIERSDN